MCYFLPKNVWRAVRKPFGVICAFLWLMVTPLHNAVASDRVLTFRVQSHDLARYLAYMQGKNPLQTNDILAPGLTRHVAELWLFQLAPVLGGCRCSVRYESYQTDTTHARAIAELVAGRVLADPVAGFREDSRYADQVWFSDPPVLPADEFLVGIYTHRSRDDVLRAANAQSLRALTYAVGSSWEIDQKVLSAKGLKWAQADNWTSALKMIEARRADAILQPFSVLPFGALAPDGYEANFVPVPGFMVRFGHGRYFTVSKRHPDGALFLQHLNAGLQRLKDSGFMSRLWVASGVVRSETRYLKELP